MHISKLLKKKQVLNALQLNALQMGSIYLDVLDWMHSSWMHSIQTQWCIHMKNISLHVEVPKGP